jgi:hypothetical protein
MEEKDQLRKALELKNARNSGRDFWLKIRL